MPININDLDAILGYDANTHSVAGLPSLGPKPYALPSATAPRTQLPAAQSAQAPDIRPDTSSTGLPSMTSPAIPAIAKPKESGWQKLTHGLETAGNIAGNVIAPGVMMNIPGTQLHNAWEQKREAGLEGEQARTGATQEATEAAKRENELVPWNDQQVTRKEWVPLEAGREREEAAATERKVAQEAEAARQQTGIAAGEQRQTERDAAQEKREAEREAASEKARQENETAAERRQRDAEEARDRELDKRLAATQGKAAEEPVYAYDPKTKQTVQTTPTEAKANGYTNVMKVNAAQIDKDKLLGSDLNDIQLNLSNYRNAIAAQGHLSPADRQAESEAINQGGAKLGAFGVQVPTDWLNKLYNSSAFNRLRDEQKSAVVAYYRAQEMIPAYQRVLTNSGRSQEKAMEIAMQSVPTPILDEGTSNKMLDGFQQNVDQVGQRQIRIPGIDTHQDVKQRIEAEWKGPANRGGGGEQGGGHSFTLNGKQYTGVPDDIYKKYKGQAGFKE